MVAEARLKSKNLYKVELYLLKIMPMVIALAYLVNTVSSYFGVGSIRYWALKIGKAHSVLSYRLKVHGIDNLRKYIEQRIKLV
jgi:hypothetical protein